MSARLNTIDTSLALLYLKIWPLAGYYTWRRSLIWNLMNPSGILRGVD